MLGYYNQQKVDNLYAQPIPVPVIQFSGIDNIWAGELDNLSYYFNAQQPFGSVDPSGVPSDGQLFFSGIYALAAQNDGEIVEQDASGFSWNASDSSINNKPYLDIPFGSNAVTNFTSVGTRGPMYMAILFEYVDGNADAVPFNIFGSTSNPPNDTVTEIRDRFGSSNNLVFEWSGQVSGNSTFVGISGVKGDGQYHLYEALGMPDDNNTGLIELYFDGQTLASNPSGQQPNGSGPTKLGGNFGIESRDCHIRVPFYLQIDNADSFTEQDMRDRIEQTRNYIRGTYGLTL